MSPFIALCFLTAFVSTATSEKGHYYLKCLYDKNQEMPYTGMQLNCDAYRDDGPSPVKQGDEVENAVQNLGNRPGNLYTFKNCVYPLRFNFLVTLSYV